MEPLYDQRGQVYAWFERDHRRILGLRGEALALIQGASVYDWDGKHIGWWEKNHMRDHGGALVLFGEDATGLLVSRPGLTFVPRRPVLPPETPHQPRLLDAPDRAPNARDWAGTMPF